MIYIGVFHILARCSDLTPFHSRLYWYFPGRRNLCLALEGHRGAREEMGRFPTAREKAGWGHSRWSTPDDRLLLAWMDRRV